MKNYVVPTVTEKPDNRPEWMRPPPASENPNIHIVTSRPSVTTSKPVTTTRQPSIVTEVVTTTSVSFVTSTAATHRPTPRPTTTTTTTTENVFVPSSEPGAPPVEQNMDCSQQDFYPHPTDCSKVKTLTLRIYVNNTPLKKFRRFGNLFHYSITGVFSGIRRSTYVLLAQNGFKKESSAAGLHQPINAASRSSLRDW